MERATAVSGTLVVAGWSNSIQYEQIDPGTFFWFKQSDPVRD